MEEKIVLTCEEVGIWALNRFNKVDSRIKRLSIGIFCLSAAVYIGGHWLKQNDKRITALETEIKALKQNDIPESE